jgi:hypothetical protein
MQTLTILTLCEWVKCSSLISGVWLSFSSSLLQSAELDIKFGTTDDNSFDSNSQTFPNNQ